MQCPSCETEHGQEQCPTALVSEVSLSMDSEFEAEIPELSSESFDRDESNVIEAGSSRLIEFPGVSRRSVPEWRKELSARVREVQERKAREAATEAEEAARLGLDTPQPIIPQLNLLPKTELPDLNPVVAAALRRIERARQPTITSYSRAATAVAVAEERQAEIEFSPDPLMDSEMEAPMPSESAPIPERTHNLVVVQAPVANEVEEVAEVTEVIEKPKPKRLIVEDDPVLSYLDNIAPAFGPANLEEHAPIFRRIMAAFADVIVVGFLSLPVAAVIELQDGNWHQVKVIALAGIATVLMFVYATVSTALTGRTFGMRLFSIRAVDVRTGLIPTGNQSAGRALFYLFTIATAGLGLLMVFARGEGKTVHDRVTHTAVIRD